MNEQEKALCARITKVLKASKEGYGYPIEVRRQLFAGTTGAQPEQGAEGRQWVLREMTEGRRALVAQAFGQFFATFAESVAYGSAGLQMQAIRELRYGMHAALGGRIPDRAERPEDAEGWCPK